MISTAVGVLSLDDGTVLLHRFRGALLFALGLVVRLSLEVQILGLNQLPAVVFLVGVP